MLSLEASSHSWFRARALKTAWGLVAMPRMLSSSARAVLTRRSLTSTSAKTEALYERGDCYRHTLILNHCVVRCVHPVFFRGFSSDPANIFAVIFVLQLWTSPLTLYKAWFATIVCCFADACNALDHILLCFYQASTSHGLSRRSFLAG
jgi:hypothetical protein